MAYEESVHIEAEQRAAELVSRPLVAATPTAYCCAAVVGIAAELIFDVPRLYACLLAGITFIAVWGIVTRQQSRYERVVAEEWHKIDKRNSEEWHKINKSNGPTATCYNH
jgi:hypothetical protein